MKTQWDIAGLTIDTTPLWTQTKGPKASDVEEGRLRAADQRFHDKIAANQTGFYDLPTQSIASNPVDVLNTVKRLQKDFEAVLVIGIGGSYLGAASVVQALGNEKFPLTWVSNIDPAAIRDAREKIKARKHACVVISKSGNTTETLAAFYHFSPDLDPRGFVTITDPASGELRRLTKENDWPSMEVPSKVGGRFSVLTPVGLLPAALGGVDIVGLVEGANKMRSFMDSCTPETNPAHLFALATYLWDEKFGHGQHFMMPYWSNMALVADWWVQIWGESLGKIDPSGRRVGPTAVGALGTTDQHSLLQLFKDGPLNKVVGFIDILGQGAETPVGKPSFRAGDSSYLCRHSFENISHEALMATQKSLANSGVPTYRITARRLDAQTLGALIFFLETTTAIAGELYGVNAFDQPGVEECKKLLHAALA
jgi:glucose-6-phosphate isomerase